MKDGQKLRRVVAVGVCALGVALLAVHRNGDAATTPQATHMSGERLYAEMLVGSHARTSLNRSSSRSAFERAGSVIALVRAEDRAAFTRLGARAAAGDRLAVANSIAEISSLAGDISRRLLLAGSGAGSTAGMREAGVDIAYDVVWVPMVLYNYVAPVFNLDVVVSERRSVRVRTEQARDASSLFVEHAADVMVLRAGA